MWLLELHQGALPPLNKHLLLVMPPKDSNSITLALILVSLWGVQVVAPHQQWSRQVQGSRTLPLSQQEWGMVLVGRSELQGQKDSQRDSMLATFRFDFGSLICDTSSMWVGGVCVCVCVCVCVYVCDKIAQIFLCLFTCYWRISPPTRAGIWWHSRRWDHLQRTGF